MLFVEDAYEMKVFGRDVSLEAIYVAHYGTRS
jgi:hypothetical protein